MARLKWLLLAGALAAVAASCSGARHRKVSGPPPEYELPDDPGKSTPSGVPQGLLTRDQPDAAGAREGGGR
jgi:hypothetical protein